MRNSVILITILLITSFNLVFAQNTIKGKVFDNKTLVPLQGVYVIYEKGKGTATDPDGSFIIETESNILTLEFKFIGYRPVTRTIEILAGKPTTDLMVGLDMEMLEIGQIVVSANKTEQRIAELTVSMDILKSGEFLKTHITDAQELINKTPGIEVLDGQASIRGGSGFSYGVGSRVLALIDGLPVLSPDAGNIKWQFLPMENISQIEIIKGASSVLYGSSALNGIINFRTADATNIPVTQFFTETGLYGKPGNRNWVWWNSPRVFSNISFSHLQKKGKTDLGIGINLLNDNGYRKLNEERLGRVSIRIKHYNKKIKGLTYGLNLNSGYTSKRDFILWENSVTGALKQDTSTASLLHGTFLAIDPYLSYNSFGSTKHDLKIRMQSTDNMFPVRYENNSKAYSVYAEYQFYYKLTNIVNLNAGISENYSKIVSNFYGDHEGINLAGFTQAEVTIIPELKFIAGIRLEQNRLNGIKDKIVPIFRTGINWQAAEFTFIRASFGQGNRYPSIAEKFASTILGSVSIFPNPTVQPETGWSSEAGIKQGVLIGNIKGQADISVFLSQNNNMIEFPFGLYPEGYGFRAENVEQSRVYGYEAELNLTRSGEKLTSSLNAGYTYIYPVIFNEITNKNTDTYLKYRRKHSLKVSSATTYRKFNLGLTLYARSKLLSIDNVFTDEATRESILPGFFDYWSGHNKGYLLLDSNLNYDVSKAISLSLAVKNIANIEYMGRPGDIQPPRNYSIRLSGKF